MDKQSLHALTGKLECARHLIERTAALYEICDPDPGVMSALAGAMYFLEEASAGLAGQLGPTVTAVYASNR